jgi:hypothetical protein
MLQTFVLKSFYMFIKMLDEIKRKLSPKEYKMYFIKKYFLNKSVSIVCFHLSTSLILSIESSTSLLKQLQ